MHACAGEQAPLHRPLPRASPAASRGRAGVTVLLAYRRADIAHPLDAVSVLLPKTEGRRALAATFVSSKWPGRAPDDSALLRVFLRQATEVAQAIEPNAAPPAASPPAP